MSTPNRPPGHLSDGGPAAALDRGAGVGSVTRRVLREVAEALAPGSPVSVPREWLLELLAGPQPTDRDGADAGADLTVKQTAAALQLSENRVRWLIGAGKLAAYRIVPGRGGWRITPAALADFRRAGVPEPAPATGRAVRVDLHRQRRRLRREGG